MSGAISMRIQDILDMAVPLGYLFYLVVPFGGLLWAAHEFGRTSMKTVADISNEREALEKQRAIGLSEDLATSKQSLLNRDAKVSELESELIKSQSDLKVLGASRPDDPRLKDYLQLADELGLRVKKFDQLRGALLGSEEELWRLRGEIPSVETADALRRSRAKVLVVANLKGGVGKTTIVTNLAAYFALKRRLRVLVIDLDYQGSLTGMMLTATKNTLGANSISSITPRWWPSPRRKASS